MFRIRWGRVLLLATYLIVSSVGIVVAEEVGEETPLQSRTNALLDSYSQARTKDERVAIRLELLAKADTLEAAGNDVLASQCLERAGMVGYRLAEYDSAREIWTRGLVVARRSGDKTRIAALLNSQAVGVSITGDNEGAIKLQTELVELRRELEDVRGEGISWHNLAFSYFALYRYPEAIQAISNALRLHREADNAYALAASMSTLGNALFEVGQLKDAMAMADSAVSRARSLNNASVQGSALEGRGRQRHYAGRFEDALADFEEAHDVLTAAGVTRVAAANDLNWANALVSLNRCNEAHDIVEAALQTLTPIGTPEELVWGDSVRARIMARCGAADIARTALLATIDRLESIRDSIPDELSRADAFRMAGGAYTDLALLEAKDGRTEDAWFTIERSTARLFNEELGLDERTTLRRLQEKLGAVNGIALQFGHGTVDRNVVSVITASDVAVSPIMISPGFRADVATALALMSSGASDDECRPVLQRIADVALKPVTDTLGGDAIRLVVFPGALAGFPIEALPLSGEGGQTVGDRFAVTYAPSATAFLHLQQREVRGGPLVVIADPELTVESEGITEVALRSSRMSLSPLPEARKEGKSIGTSGTVLVGADATRVAFLEHASASAVLHVATHAVIDGTHPDHSGIVLAGAGGDMMTVEHLRGLDLDADLISLSGCKTAGGYIATGDGAFGLTRAFLLAGGRSVVSSWWDVEDAAARHFMELYYELLRDGSDRDIALQHVRIKMAAQGYPHRDRTAFALAGATAQPVLTLAQGSWRPRPVVVGVLSVLIFVIVTAGAARRRSGNSTA